MLAVWGCRLGLQEHIGSYSDRAFNFGILRTISGKLLGAFERRGIHKLKNLPSATFCNLLLKKKCLKHSAASNGSDRQSFFVSVLRRGRTACEIETRRHIVFRLDGHRPVWVGSATRGE